MQLSDIPNVYLAVGVGAVIWAIGQKLSGSETSGKLVAIFGRILTYAGFAVFAAGLYAGIRGPVTIAGVTLGTFPLTKKMAQANAETLAYSKSSLDISRTPAVGWGGISKTLLQYTVKNNGEKEIGSMVVRLATTDGSFLDLALDGPFPGMKTTSKIVEIPPQVKRSYFTSATAPPGEIISAR